MLGCADVWLGIARYITIDLDEPAATVDETERLAKIRSPVAGPKPTDRRDGGGRNGAPAAASLAVGSAAL